MTKDPMETLYSSLKLAGDAAAAAYQEGLVEGYRRGYRDAIEAAKKIIDGQYKPSLEKTP